MVDSNTGKLALAARRFAIQVFAPDSVAIA
jgi:hypothetical protein